MHPIDYTPLKAYLQQWVRSQPYGWHQRRAQNIASDWLNDVAFADIKLARLLENPTAEAIFAVVRTVVLPYPSSRALLVLVEAIHIAARQQTTKRVAWTAIGGLAVAALIYMASQNRGTSNTQRLQARPT